MAALKNEILGVTSEFAVKRWRSRCVINMIMESAGINGGSKADRPNRLSSAKCRLAPFVLYTDFARATFNQIMRVAIGPGRAMRQDLWRISPPGETRIRFLITRPAYRDSAISSSSGAKPLPVATKRSPRCDISCNETEQESSRAIIGRENTFANALTLRSAETKANSQAARRESLMSVLIVE